MHRRNTELILSCVKPETLISLTLTRLDVRSSARDRNEVTVAFTKKASDNPFNLKQCQFCVLIRFIVQPDIQCLLRWVLLNFSLFPLLFRFLWKQEVGFTHHGILNGFLGYFTQKTLHGSDQMTQVSHFSNTEVISLISFKDYLLETFENMQIVSVGSFILFPCRYHGLCRNHSATHKCTKL